MGLFRIAAGDLAEGEEIHRYRHVAMLLPTLIGR